MICCFAALVCIIFAYGASRLRYKIDNPNPTVYFDSATFTKIFILFAVFGLLMFAIFQYYVFNGKHELFEPTYLASLLLAAAIFIGIPLVLHQIQFPYYYYLVDTGIIVVVFCSLSFMIGYYGKEDKKKSVPIPMVSMTKNGETSAETESDHPMTRRERIINGLYFFTTEVLVSATALVYGMFFVTLYSSLSDFYKVIWRLAVHPLYFELFMMLPVRYLVARKMRTYSDCNILYTLSVVHAQSHISTLGRMMFATMDNLSITFLSVGLLNVGKVFFRLSSPLRDMIVFKLLHKGEMKTEHDDEHKRRQRYISAAGMQDELIVENACILFSGFMMYFFQENKVMFMFPYPSGYLSIQTVVIITVIQLVLALICDLITLYIAEIYLHLPVLKTWEAMWEKRYRYFGFLLYGLFTMGLMGIIYMGFRVPRGSFCPEADNVCSCVWLGWMGETCDGFIANAAL